MKSNKETLVENNNNNIGNSKMNTEALQNESLKDAVNEMNEVLIKTDGWGNEIIPKTKTKVKVAKIKVSKKVNKKVAKKVVKKVKKVKKVVEPKVKLNANGKPVTKVESTRCDELAYIVYSLMTNKESKIPYRNLRINSQYYGQRQMLKIKPSKRLEALTSTILNQFNLGAL